MSGTGVPEASGSGVNLGVRFELPDDALEAIAQRAADIVIERLRGEQADGSPWLTLAQAAKYLRTSTRTVQRLVQCERLRPSHGTGRPLFHRAELDKAASGEETARTVPSRRREK